MLRKIKILRPVIIKENQILLTFADEDTADYVRKVCRRKGMDLESYILDNFEWDGMPECLSAFFDGKITKKICKDCDDRSHCRDRKVR